MGGDGSLYLVVVARNRVVSLLRLTSPARMMA
jgi:hypothetical protein